MTCLNKMTRLFVLGLFVISPVTPSFANPLFSAMGQDERPYSANTPLVLVDSIEKSLAYYVGVFGFFAHNVLKDDGKIFHAELTHEKTVILMISPYSAPDGEMTNYGKTPKERGGKPSFNFYVYVDDVDELAGHIKAYRDGQHVVQEPRDEFWGDRTAMFTDPDGYLWVFATKISPEQTPK